ncbi:MAG: helix-turn-helix domain-containing protein [Nevskiales bacterium]
MPPAQAQSSHPTPAGATIYYWPCTILLVAQTMLLERSFSPIFATLRIACREPFTMDVGDGQKITCRAVLIPPKVERKRMVALNSDLAAFYLPIEYPEYAGLEPVVRDKPYVILDFERFAHLRPQIRAAFAGSSSGEEVKALTRAAVEAVTGNIPVERVCDIRVEQARRILNDLPLEDVSLSVIAKQLNLSPSRLRHLFKEKTGSTISSYARWQAVWRAILLWKQGCTMTEIAHGAGFYDLAHFDRAFVEVFGLNPLAAADPRYIRLVRCD